jgi:hypothetical protein
MIPVHLAFPSQIDTANQLFFQNLLQTIASFYLRVIYIIQSNLSNMKLAVLLGLAAQALAVAIPDNVAFTEGPDPTQVQIVGLTYGGTGCPSGTVSSILSDDRTIMTLIFDEFVASIGPGIRITEARKNCQLNLNLRYPGGFQYSIFSADYRGYAYLEKGVTGTQRSAYYFSGQIQQVSQHF